MYRWQSHAAWAFKCPEHEGTLTVQTGAAFYEAKGHRIGQSVADRDVTEGSTDTPQEAMV